MFVDTLDGFLFAGSRISDRTTISVAPLIGGRVRVAHTNADAYRNWTVGDIGQT